MAETRDGDPITAAGTNLRDAPAGGAWTYLLDSMEMEAALFVGQPSPATLETLQRVASTVAVNREVPEDGGPYDLVAIDCDHAAGRHIEGWGRARRLLAAQGQAFLICASEAEAARQTPGGAIKWLSLAPASGEVQSVAPLGDHDVSTYLFAHGLDRARPSKRLRLFGSPAPTGIARGRLGLLTGATKSKSAQVPRYVANMAAEAGLSLDGYRVGLSATGRYRSRKVLMLLFPPTASLPDVVVKLTRGSEFNHRLINEASSLMILSKRQLAAPGSVPALLFQGVHGDIAAVGETAVHGRPLPSLATSPAASAAHRWLVGLGQASAIRADNGENARRWAREITTGLEGAFPLSESTRSGLRRARDTVCDGASAIPTVFMHGDAGSWNAVVASDGVAFLDWEAADELGMPLWDSAHLGRSLVLDRATVRRWARRPRHLIRALQADIDFQRALRDTQERLGLPGHVIGPLIALGWAHRALRELPRLPVNRLGRSHYLGLLSASLEADWLGRPVPDSR